MKNKKIVYLAFIIILIILIYSLLPKDFFSKIKLSFNQPVSSPQVPIKTVSSNSDFLKVLVKLNSTSESDEGTLLLTKDQKETKAIIKIPSYIKDLDQPAAIYKGSCASPGKIYFSLSNVINGESTTELNASLRSFADHLPLTVVINKSFDDGKIISYCGDILIQWK